MDSKQLILVSGIVLAVGFLASGQSFSGLVSDSNCQWEVIEASGTEFSSFEELKQYMGESDFQDKVEEFESKENLDVRDPAVGPVEYKYCIP